MLNMDKWRAKIDETRFVFLNLHQRIMADSCFICIGINLVIFNSLIFCCLLNIY